MSSRGCCIVQGKCTDKIGNEYRKCMKIWLQTLKKGDFVQKKAFWLNNEGIKGALAQPFGEDLRSGQKLIGERGLE